MLSPSLVFRWIINCLAVLVLLSSQPVEANQVLNLEGHLTTLIIDHNRNTVAHDHGKAEFLYNLNLKNGKALRLKFTKEPKDPRKIDLIKVAAYKDGQQYIVDSYKVLDNPKKAKLFNASQTEVTGVQTTLVVLIRDSLRSSFSFMQSKSEVEQSYFSNSAPSLQDYIRQVSENKTSFSGEVVDTIGVPNLCAGGNLFLDFGDLKALSATIQAGYDLKDYERISFILPEDNSCLAAGVGGVGTVGKATLQYADGSIHRISYNFVKSWEPRSSVDNVFLNTVIHEFGHNFGLPHDNANVCGEEIFSSSCNSLEYGGSHSVMGVGPTVSHLNAVNQIDLGWLAASEVQTLSLGQTIDQEFTISALESDDTSLKALRIPRSDGTYYVVEYRENHHYDARPVLSGLSSTFGGVLIYHNDDSAFYNSILLASDMQDRRAGLTQSDFGNYFDSQLAFAFNALAPFNNVFYDDVNAIRITPLSFDSTSARFRVETNVGADGATSQEEDPDDPLLQNWSISGPEEMRTGYAQYFRILRLGHAVGFNDYDIASVDWDYDSDGVIDATVTDSLAKTLSYEEDGSYQVTAFINFEDGRTAFAQSDVVESVQYLNYNLRPRGVTSASGENTVNSNTKSRFILELRNPQSLDLKKLRIAPYHPGHRAFVRLPKKAIKIRAGSIYNLPVTLAPDRIIRKHISPDDDGYYNLQLEVFKKTGKRRRTVYDTPVIRIKAAN